MKGNNDDYERGYSKGFIDGFQAARSDPSLLYPNIPYNKPKQSQPLTGCNVCSIDFSKGVWGYVCNHPHCPTRVTCSYGVQGSTIYPSTPPGANGGTEK